jgi:hypothetical protein
MTDTAVSGPPGGRQDNTARRDVRRGCVLPDHLISANQGTVTTINATMKITPNTRPRRQ